jgi:predicted nucleic-acid-binding protein
MFALDTNVLVRYIVQDDKAQTERAVKVIDSLRSEKPAFISCIVLCELNWVLKSFYKISKKERLDVLQKILSVAVFDVERLDVCLKAHKLYEKGSADFSDYIIQQTGAEAGYSSLLTFDKNALKNTGFKAP